MKKELIFLCLLFSAACFLCFLRQPVSAQPHLSADSGGPVRYPFVYENSINSPGLQQLAMLYRLDSVAPPGDTDLQQMLALMNWAHTRWSHSGSHEPSQATTSVILEEAAKGARFRCVEYTMVLRSILAARGFKARSLALKTQDCETRFFGAGHVLAEAWLPSKNKWVLLDPQFNWMPFGNGEPLNAVELQQALADKDSVVLANLQSRASEAAAARYLRFIKPYLFYFDTPFDQRELSWRQKQKVEDRSTLMLVPKGAKQPTIFQRKFPMDDVIYTGSVASFYAAP